MSVFVDTSALYAIGSASDRDHRHAKELLQALLDRRESLLTTSYVLVETLALLQRRIGLDVASRLVDLIVPSLEVAWVTSEEHQAGWRQLLRYRRRSLNIVDGVSFVIMRSRGISAAFAFDQDFRLAGFRTL